MDTISAVAGITKNRNLWGTTQSAFNTFMNSAFGCGQDVEFAKALIKEKKGVKAAWTEAKLGESWWASFKKAFTPSEMKEEWKLYRDGTETVKAAGKLRSAGRFFMKRMPFIGNAIYLATEAPNIYRAFTDEKHGGGIGTGIKETVKFGIKAVAFAAGMALGGLISGGILGLAGGLVGGSVGSWIADKILGKSFTEQKEEKEAEQAQLAQKQAAQALPFTGNNSQKTAANSYGNNSLGMNPYDKTGLSSNSIFQADWKDKDLMAMSVGLA